MLHSKKIIRILLDFLALNLAFAIPAGKDGYWNHPYFLMGLVIANLLWFSVFLSDKLYSRFEYPNFTSEFGLLLNNVMAHFLFFLPFASYLLYIPLFVLLSFYALFLAFLLQFRFCAYYFLSNPRNIETLNYIVVGEHKKLQTIQDCLHNGYMNNTQYLGYFTDTIPSPPRGERLLGSVQDIYKYLSDTTHQVRLILYAHNNLPASELCDLINYSHAHFIDFKMTSEHCGVLSDRIKLEIYEGQPLFSIAEENIARLRNRGLKRLFDIVFSLLVLVGLCSWLFLIIGIWIRLSSKGPIFFVQKRVGYRGKHFNCLKFRSMVVNNQANSHQATQGDARITKVGAFIRKTNIDELPQFVNVLLGDMSVIGPRPHALFTEAEFNNEIKDYILRYYTKPGVSGWAQVNGFRGPTQTMEQKLGRTEHDLWYLRNWSFGLDMQIIWMTVFGSKVKENAF